MTSWHHLLTCAFVVFRIVRGEVEDIKPDSDRRIMYANEAHLENAFENSNERNHGHLTGEDYQFDEAPQTQLRWKNENSRPYNREHSEYIGKVNNGDKRKTPSRNDESFIQVPNNGGRLENIKKEHFSSNNNEIKTVQYNSQGGSYDRDNRRLGYESVLDPSSGYHIISERKKNHNDVSDEEQDQIVLSQKNADSGDHRSQAEDNIKILNMNARSNQGSHTSLNGDKNEKEAQQKKTLSHDSMYLVNPNIRNRIEPIVESSGMKDIFGNVNGDYSRKTESVPDDSSNAHEVKRNQMWLPRQTNEQEYNAYQQHEPQNNFDRRLVNIENEKKPSSNQRYVEEEYIEHPNEESTHFQSEQEYDEKDKFNVPLEYTDHQIFSQGYGTKQQLPKEGIIESNELEESKVPSHAAQPIEAQNLKLNSQQLRYKIREDGVQLQNNRHEKNELPIGTSPYQTDDKSEGNMYVHNLDYVPQQVRMFSYNQDKDPETQKQTTTGSGYYEQLINNYEHELPLPSKTLANQNHPQLSHVVPKEIIEVVNDETNFQHGAKQIGYKHLEDHNSDPFLLEYTQQHAQPEKNKFLWLRCKRQRNSSHGIFITRAPKYEIQ